MKCLVEEITKVERDIKYPFYAYNEGENEECYYKVYLEEKMVDYKVSQPRKFTFLIIIEIIKSFIGLEVNFKKYNVSSDVVNIPKECYYAHITCLEDDSLVNEIEEILKDVKQSF